MITIKGFLYGLCEQFSCAIPIYLSICPPSILTQWSILLINMFRAIKAWQAAAVVTTGGVTICTLSQMRNISNLGEDLCLGLILYSSAMCRYCFKIKPSNMPLAIANGVNIITTCYLLWSKIKWNRNEKGKLLRRF